MCTFQAPQSFFLSKLNKIWRGYIINAKSASSILNFWPVFGFYVVFKKYGDSVFESSFLKFSLFLNQKCKYFFIERNRSLVNRFATNENLQVESQYIFMSGNLFKPIAIKHPTHAFRSGTVSSFHWGSGLWMFGDLEQRVW